MSRAKKKRVNALRRKQARRVERLLRREARDYVPPFLSAAIGRFVYESVREYQKERASQPQLPPVLDVFFDALEASGMRRVVCKCGREWLTRTAADTCPPCRERARTAN